MTTWRSVWFSLGSNLGDCAGHLQSAVDFICASPNFVDVKVSQVWRTKAIGGPEQPDYLNAVVHARTDAQARDILSFSHACEAQRNRQRDERWGPRTLDVDIIAIEGEAHDTAELQVPHPRACSRGFVLVPLAELADPELLLGSGLVLDTAGMQLTDVVLRVNQKTTNLGAEVESR